MSEAKTKTQSMISEVLPGPVIEMIKMTPGSPQTRSQVHACLRTPIPKEADTFYKIRDWIEANFSPVMREIPLINAHGHTLVQDARPNPAVMFSINVEASGVECGTCKYKQGKYGSDSFHFSEQCIRDMFEESDSLEDMIEAAETEIRENWSDCISVDDDGEVETFDNEPGEDNINHSYSETILEQRIQGALIQLGLSFDQR